MKDLKIVHGGINVLLSTGRLFKLPVGVSTITVEDSTAADLIRSGECIDITPDVPKAEPKGKKK